MQGLKSHFIFGREDKEHYVMCSDNLHLVSLLEAVSADGFTLPPVFVSAKSSPLEWWTVPGVGR